MIFFTKLKTIYFIFITFPFIVGENGRLVGIGAGEIEPGRRMTQMKGGKKT